MCKLFIQADSTLWENVQRSLRLDGAVTSIRLENVFWKILQEIAERDQLSLSALITRLYYESIEADHDMTNFTSFLRVCCSRYLSLQLSGHIPGDKNVAIASLDADTILLREADNRDAVSALSVANCEVDDLALNSKVS